MKRNIGIQDIYYCADLNIPSHKAYTIHVMKMMNEFSKFAINSELIVHHAKKNINFIEIKKFFALTSKNFFLIKGLFEKKKSNNFFSRVCFGLLSSLYLKKKNGLIITRSFYCSFFLIVFKKKHFLEIHNSLNGITKILFMSFGLINSKFIIKIIFITKSLKNYFNIDKNKSIVLHDGVDLINFKKNKILKKKISNILYAGSFYEGRGVDLILNIAKVLKNKRFYLYGKRKNDNFFLNKFNLNNVKIFPMIEYRKIFNKIKNADLLLMPYSLNRVSIGVSKNDDTSKFASPIKMFEYLASGIPFISSNLNVLKEVLKNKKNCIIAINNSTEEWVNRIIFLEKNLSLRKKIIRNAVSTAQQYTWFERVEKIVKIYIRNIKY
jgi:glycosyltransferase involved in cell wall biosynthesis